MGKIYCTECGTELDDSVKFCSNCGKSLSHEDNASKPSEEIINKNNFSTDDIIGKMQILPIIVGIILSYILWGFVDISLFISTDASVTFSLILGTMISGYLCKNDIKFALIYGTIVSIVTAILIDSSHYITTYHPEFYFICIISGLVGAFIGNVMRAKIKDF